MLFILKSLNLYFRFRGKNMLLWWTAVFEKCIFFYFPDSGYLSFLSVRLVDLIGFIMYAACLWRFYCTLLICCNCCHFLAKDPLKASMCQQLPSSLINSMLFLKFGCSVFMGSFWLCCSWRKFLDTGSVLQHGCLKVKHCLSFFFGGGCLSVL